MNVPPSAQLDPAELNHIAQFRHDLLTPINHILGFTEVQIEDAPDAGLLDCVPAFTEINTAGRTLLAIIEAELDPRRGVYNLQRLDARIESEAGPVLSRAKKLAEHLHAIGQPSVAEDVDLVSGALQSLLSLSHEVVQASLRK